MAIPEWMSRIAVAQMRARPGDVKKNLETILGSITSAAARGASIVVLPELATSGYLLGDRWEHNAFIREIGAANETIREASRGMVVIWGSVKADWTKIGEDGRVRKYNAAFIAENGHWVDNGALVGWIPKTNLPKYRMFDDARHFFPAAQFAAENDMTLADILRPFTVGPEDLPKRIALAVCEDLWEDEYATKPSRLYHGAEPDLVVDISMSPWTAEKWHAREGMLERRTRDIGSPILYVNAVGLQNNGKNLVWFDGDSQLRDSSGCRWSAPRHRDGVFLVSDSGGDRARSTGIAEVYEALIPAMREFFSPFPRVVIGLSGGIDSAVMAALLADALGPGKVLAVAMPTEFNSPTTRQLAEDCARSLGIELRRLPIQELYERQLALLGDGGFNPSPLARENIQARIRGQMLAAIAQCEGGVFANTGNKTEIALNYFTLYGDGAGAASFLGDLWKGQVYELARLLNARAGRERIPAGILALTPSAELSNEQNVDEGKGDPIFYPYHDRLLRAFIEWRWDPTTVLERLLAGTLETGLGCEAGTLARYFPTRTAFVGNLEWAWRQYSIEWKHVQLPPVFIASRRAFGFDRRDTIADAYFTDAYACMRTPLLGSPDEPIPPPKGDLYDRT